MLSPLVLAYIGDAVYEIYIRKFLISKKIAKVSELQKASLEFVSAKSQRQHYERLVNNNFITETEIEIFKQGRNTKGTKSRSTDIITYRIATGLETLIGYLYENNNTKRIEEIMNFITGE